jgi:hypothetical protein
LHPYTKKEIATIEDFTSLAKGLKVDWLKPNFQMVMNELLDGMDDFKRLH